VLRISVADVLLPTLTTWVVACLEEDRSSGGRGMHVASIMIVPPKKIYIYMKIDHKYKTFSISYKGLTIPAVPQSSVVQAILLADTPLYRIENKEGIL
jgi:hypothetical protein